MKLEYSLIVIESFFRVHLCTLSNMITKVKSLDVLQHHVCIFIVLGLKAKVATNLVLKNKNPMSNPKNINPQPVEER